MIRAIAHPTDFSAEGQMAFVHALRLAMAHRCHLDLMHVRAPGDEDRWGRFPRVREVLARWGVLTADASVDDIAQQTGVTVRKVEIRDADAVEGLSRFLISHRPELIVMASHGRSGLNRWLSGSVSSEVARETHAPTLMFGPHAQGFVDPETGHLGLGTILVPVAASPAPMPALRALDAVFDGLDARFDLVHVGDGLTKLHDPAGTVIPVRQIDGSVVDVLVQQASDDYVSMVAMPTAGQQGFLDALRGSTTEQVVHQAIRPVLAIPA